MILRIQNIKKIQTKICSEIIILYIFLLSIHYFIKILNAIKKNIYCIILLLFINLCGIEVYY